jgi:osmotically-inducible protein OsmY
MADREELNPRADDDDRSWMDRCADEEVAGRGPHRGRGPQSWAPDDQRIYEIVCERLLQDRLIDARGMEVEVEDGVVTLRGSAAHASDPALARMLVRETPGVKEVVTELRIEGPRRATRPELGTRTSGYSGHLSPGEADEAGRRQGPWASPSGAA